MEGGEDQDKGRTIQHEGLLKCRLPPASHHHPDRSKHSSQQCSTSINHIIITHVLPTLGVPCMACTLIMGRNTAFQYWRTSTVASGAVMSHAV